MASNYKWVQRAIAALNKAIDEIAWLPVLDDIDWLELALDHIQEQRRYITKKVHSLKGMLVAANGYVLHVVKDNAYVESETEDSDERIELERVESAVKDVIKIAVKNERHIVIDSEKLVDALIGFSGDVHLHLGSGTKPLLIAEDDMREANFDDYQGRMAIIMPMSGDGSVGNSRQFSLEDEGYD